ncbi:MAG: sugar phosphate isomerase/epimerase family protein [Candidatus Ornithospirochaeta sp.]
MKFGLCTDIRNVIEVQEAGFDYIEGKLNQFALWPEEEFQNALSLFDSSSIKMEAASLLLPKTMKAIGSGYDEDGLMSYLDTAFSRMDELSCSLVVFGSGKSRMLDEGERWQDGFLSLVEVTRKIGLKAKEHGISIAIEPLNRSETNMINTLSEGAALEAVVALDNVGLLADAYHMRKEEEEMERILRCSPLLHTHIALKEGRGYPVEKSEEVEEFFRVLKTAGYDGRMSIEGKSDDWKSDGRKALEVLRSYIGA